MNILIDIVLPVLGLFLTIGVFIYMIVKNGIEERQKMKEEHIHTEAEILSKKMKESNIEIAVKKPQSFKTKRKPQKKLDK